MINLDLKSKPWQVFETNADEFYAFMCDIGVPQETSPVMSAAADPDDPTVRTAHRDTPLPFHRDGIRGEAIAAMQGGMYVEKPDVDVVGMYCIRPNSAGPCITVFSQADTEEDAPNHIVARLDLKAGQAVIWDNRLWHAREGGERPVGDRLLIRFWTTLHDKSILAPGDTYKLRAP